MALCLSKFNVSLTDFICANENGRMNKRILGIDPGSRIAGYGVLEYSPQGEIFHIAHGALNVESKTDDFYQRICRLGLQFREVIELYKPQAVAVENIFLGKNADSAFKLGHARGILTYEVMQRGIKVHEYSTRSIKKSVTGTGAADKEEVQRVLRLLLKIPAVRPYDASDALAVAYHHAVYEMTAARLQIRQRRMELR
jgi:crossover junction endodeoxyribonuclease RuvC